MTLTPHVVRLRPAPHCRTPILSYSLKVEPEPHFLNWQQDPYSNYLARLVFPEADAGVLEVEVDLVAELTVINPFDFFVEASAESYPFEYEPVLARELIPYLETRAGRAPSSASWSSELRREPTSARSITWSSSTAGCSQDDRLRDPDGAGGPDLRGDARRCGSGSCRDSAWLLVQVLRHLGLAARFVSGYLIQLMADVKAARRRRRAPSSDFTDLHAWAEVYVPGAGWIGLDPTSGLLAGEGHIPLACAADPLERRRRSRGSFTLEQGPGRERRRRACPTFRVPHGGDADPRRPRASPSRTPRSSGRRSTASATGSTSGSRAGDVRLTMGGEPTFVSIDDMEGAEWNTAALGPAKRRSGGRAAHAAPRPVRPGRHAPLRAGEVVPGRVAAALGARLLLAARRRPRLGRSRPVRRRGARLRPRHGATPGGSSTTLAERLGRRPDALHARATRTSGTTSGRSAGCRSTSIRSQSKLDDPEERRRLAKVFEQGLGHVVGYALPLRRERSADEPRWVSGPWFLRREHLFLLPGDSPMGFRLPLDSLPWASPGDREPVRRARPVRPPRAARRRARHCRAAADRRAARRGRGRDVRRSSSESADAVPRRAVGPRGRPHGALRRAARRPPARLHAAAQACSRITSTWSPPSRPPPRELQLPVLIEGYHPPHDHRLNHFSVTPDPGVIEVNIHPAHSWDELVEQTTDALRGSPPDAAGHREVHARRPAHRAPAAATTSSSAARPRPTARSCAGPTCSAAWSPTGTTIRRCRTCSRACSSGPTSQAPRVDEARNDSLYEMEIAFRQIPDHGGCPPWLVDRVFRHLLVDVTGNTHRAEFCIDKLYSPDTAERPAGAGRAAGLRDAAARRG